MKRICIKFPSRERKDKFFNCLDNIIENIGWDNYYILCTLDLDDETMNNQEVRERLKGYADRVLPIYGNSTGKINAINRDLELVDDCDILILTSDDMWFEKRGFGKEVVEDFEQYFSDLDGLIHYPDGYANERLITMPIMGLPYLNRSGYIYHNSYFSVYADNEQHLVAQKLGKYKFINKKLFIHKHVVWGHGVADELLKKTESFYEVDRITFNKRQSINFGLND